MGSKNVFHYKDEEYYFVAVGGKEGTLYQCEKREEEWFIIRTDSIPNSAVEVENIPQQLKNKIAPKVVLGSDHAFHN